MRLGVGLTFQTNRAYHNLTVRQNLEAPLRVARGDRPKDAEERFGYALQLFGLDLDDATAWRASCRITSCSG